jgi:uncharacterized protein YecE (DUF72 family)
MVRRRSDARIACEPRHPAWFAPEVDALWDRYAIARVAADPAPSPQAARPGGPPGARWRYWRWHGSPRMYYSAYGDAALRTLAGGLMASSSARAPGWCIFDNTAHGHAVADAARLQAMLRNR